MEDQGHNGENDTRSICVKSVSDATLPFALATYIFAVLFSSSFAHYFSSKHENGALSYFWKIVDAVEYVISNIYGHSGVGVKKKVT